LFLGSKNPNSFSKALKHGNSLFSFSKLFKQFFRVAVTMGAFQFLSIADKKPNKEPLSLHVPAALAGENPKNGPGCSKSEMHPVTMWRRVDLPACLRASSSTLNRVRLFIEIASTELTSAYR